MATKVGGNWYQQFLYIRPIGIIASFMKKKKVFLRFSPGIRRVRHLRGDWVCGETVYEVMYSF